NRPSIQEINNDYIRVLEKITESIKKGKIRIRIGKDGRPDLGYQKGWSSYFMHYPRSAADIFTWDSYIPMPWLAAVSSKNDYKDPFQYAMVNTISRLNQVMKEAKFSSNPFEKILQDEANWF
ncbi:MAG: hypothetical protein WCG95_07345, partial [bacterium]